MSKKYALFYILIIAFSFYFEKSTFAQEPTICERFMQSEYDVQTKKQFYENNPTYTHQKDDSESWSFSSPEYEDMDANFINRAISELENTPEILSFLVVRNNALVAEKYFHGSQRMDSNNIHSASKSILSAAIGVAIEKSYIKSAEQSLFELLPKKYKTVHSEILRNITLRHLLTMTSGYKWTEDNTEYKIEKHSDWVKEILKLKTIHAPGETFNYSTGMTHLMSVILTEATKMNTCDFVHQNIFNKIGIVADHWGSDPQGYFSGGFNVYLTARDLTKFGMLVLQDGRWKGEQIIPSKWLVRSLMRQVDAHDGYEYGYNWWLKQIEGHDVAIAWGWGGQFIYVIKDLNIVVTMTTNTKDFTPDFNGEKILKDYIFPSIR